MNWVPVVTQNLPEVAYNNTWKEGERPRQIWRPNTEQNEFPVLFIFFFKSRFPQTEEIKPEKEKAYFSC